LALDPGSPDARLFLANALTLRVLEQMTDAGSTDLARAEHLLEDTRNSPRRRPLAHFTKGQILRAQNRHDAALPEYETTIALDRNSVPALAALGQCQFRAGLLDDAMAAQEQAIRLSPRDPYIANYYWRIGMTYLLQSHMKQAVAWLEKARNANSRLAGPHAWLASAYALIGDKKLAVAELAESRRLSGDNRYASIGRFKSRGFLGSPRTHELAETTFFAGLRKAGVPEE
jgi:adenylate cyclase